LLNPPAPAVPRPLLIAVVVLFAALLWGVHAWLTLARPQRALFSFDSAEYALAGRELAQTGRLATPFAYVGTLREGAHPPYPLLAGHPLLPLLEAAVFRVCGVHAWGSLVPVALGYLVTVALAMRLAVAAGSSWPLAAIAGVALAGTPAMLANASDGLTELPFAAAWTAALLVLAEFRRTPRALLLGVLLGLAHLARPVVVPTLPVWLVAVAWSAGPDAARRVRRVAELLAGFIPFALAIVLYKWRTTGSPFTDVGSFMLLVGLAPEFQSQNVARFLHPPDAVAWIRTHPGALAHKLAGSLPLMAGNALHLGGWAAGLGFVAWLLRPRRDGSGPLRLVTGGTLVAMAGLAALTLPRVQYLFPALPAAVALGAGELERLGRAARLPRGLPLAIVAALLSWSSVRPLAAEWASIRRTTLPESAFHEADLVRFGRAVAERVPPGTLVASDMAPWVSWYGERPSVNVPLSTDDLAELRARHGLGAIVLTNEWLVTLPGNEAWRDALDGRAALPGWSAGDTLAFGRLHVRILLPN
jgi:4-amino-4-deoxy-L-arabinose transferase-like glycosyltransferase